MLGPGQRLGVSDRSNPKKGVLYARAAQKDVTSSLPVLFGASVREVRVEVGRLAEDLAHVRDAIMRVPVTDEKVIEGYGLPVGEVFCLGGAVAEHHGSAHEVDLFRSRDRR